MSDLRVDLPTTAAATAGDIPRARPSASSFGHRIGRYVLLREIGQGGMGSVWEAYDPALDRVIALKLVVDYGARGDAALLEGEARALARVRDPNVVAVHDAGRENALLYIAMELVRGKTLKVWLSDGSPSIDRIVDVLCASARGIAAIHAAGLVHRDIKPSNILLGDDGRVCIGDLGIALRDDDSGAGSIAGTPGYMAPEQRDGTRTNARSDQYGFCVTAREALEGPALPSALRAIIERGLRHDPDERWPAMTDLVRALEHWRGRRRRALVWGAGVIATCAAAGGLFLALGPDDTGSACTAVDAEIDQVWTSPRRAALAQAFAGVTSPVAEGAWRRTESIVDGWVGRWRAARIEACEATRIRHTQPADVMERRATCLTRRSGDLDALLAALATPDAESAPLATSAAWALGPPEACLTDTEVQEPDPAPVRELRRRLSSARALRKLGKPVDAIPIAEEIAKAAAAVSDRALHAEALLEVGTSQSTASRHDAALASLELAIRTADRAGVDELRFMAWAELELLVGEIKSDRTAGQRALDQLGALYDRLPPSKLREAVLSERSAGYARIHGDYRTCIATAERAEALRRELDPADLDAQSDPLNLRAVCLERSGEDRVAYPIFERVLDMRRRALGDDHPRVAVIYNNLASVSNSQGDQLTAERLHEKALAIRRRVLPSGHRDLAQSHNNLANVLIKLGRADEAFMHAEAAHKIWSESVGPRTVVAATATSVMGHAARAQKRLQLAEELYRRALDIRLEVRGPNHEDVTRVMNDLANLLIERGKVAEAIALAEDALRRNRAREDAPPEVAAAHLRFALVLSADPQQRARAVALAREACPTLDDPDYTEEKATCEAFVARGGVRPTTP